MRKLRGPGSLPKQQSFFEGGVVTSWHAMTSQEVMDLLETRSDGLTSGEAASRLLEVGHNRLETRRPPGRWRLFFAQFESVLVWVLIAAAVVSGLMLGDLVDAGVIMAIVVLNAVIGFTQEVRASDALARLEEMAAPHAQVVRGSRRVSVDVDDIVPGDIVVLTQGDRVPADCRLVEAVNLGLNEAPLTGESLPVTKSTEPCLDEVPVADRTSMVFRGTAVVSGRGTAVVVGTGRETEVGKIADLLEAEEPPSPLQLELDRIGRRIAVLAGIAAVAVFGLGALRETPLAVLLLTAVALAVAAIPEGLPAVTTITLARGVRAMAARNAIVRRLPAVEALGAATVICTDKTGTLTQNRMRVQYLVVDGKTIPADEMHRSNLTETAGRVALLCSDTVFQDGSWQGEPTEVALVEAFDFLDADQVRSALPRVDEVPFDSESKRMTTVHRDNGGYLVATKGAPEVVVERCALILTEAGSRQLDAVSRDRWLEVAARLAADGLRTLALAYKSVDKQAKTTDNDLVLVGISAMSDEIRESAPAAVEAARQAGINVVMVTGDHEVTARAVADRLGLLDGRDVVSGRLVRELDAKELSRRIPSIGVFARVNPGDKVEIVGAWQTNSGIVAMTGDGINDAPALRMADIGVAMGSGTDVAQESADIVLADDDFASIVAAVEKGREIFSNLKKVVYFLIAANISEIIVMLGGFLLFGGLGEPLLAVQLLWINLVTDGFPALALGVDAPSHGLMKRPPDTDRNILGRAHQMRLAWQGAVIAAGPLAIYGYGSFLRDLPWEQVRTMAFTTIVISQLLFAYLVRAQTSNVWRSRPQRSPWLAAAALASMMLQLLVIFTPVGRALFETALFPPVEWFAVAAAAIVPFLIIDLVKDVVRKKSPEKNTAYD